MIQAGAKPITWGAVVAEWAPDYTSPERNLVNDVVLQHGGGVGLAAEYMIAQLAAGLVSAPAWATEPARLARRSAGFSATPTPRSLRTGAVAMKALSTRPR